MPTYELRGSKSDKTFFEVEGLGTIRLHPGVVTEKSEFHLLDGTQFTTTRKHMHRWVFTANDGSRDVASYHQRRMFLAGGPFQFEDLGLRLVSVRRTKAVLALMDGHETAARGESLNYRTLIETNNPILKPGAILFFTFLTWQYGITGNGVARMTFNF